MGARPEKLRMFGAVSEVDELAWDSVEQQLETAGTYWVVARGDGHPHPRPVWGVWIEDELFLSIGSPVISRELAADPLVTVHLDSGTDVVVVEGTAAIAAADALSSAIALYDRKYDWSYDIAEYGPFTVVTPSAVMAWCAAGPAGRDGFRRASRWRFGSSYDFGPL